MASPVFRYLLTRRSTRAQLLAYALCGAFCFPAQADVIFSNITGPGSVMGATVVCAEFTFGNCDGLGTIMLAAAAFTPTANYTMTDAQVFVASVINPLPGRSSFDVYLYSDSGGAPGSPIERIGAGLSATTILPGSIVTANTISTPITLTSGTQYWLVLTPPNYLGSFIYWANGGSPRVPTATRIMSIAFPPGWMPGTGSLQFQIDGVQGVQSPPSVTCAATPNTLWPPNGQPVLVTVSGTVTPGTQPINRGSAAYAVADEYSQVQPNGLIILGDGGRFSFEVSLIAARNGDDHDGRTYTIVVGAKDVIGNLGSCSTVVTVPHDQRN